MVVLVQDKESYNGDYLMGFGCVFGVMKKF